MYCLWVFNPNSSLKLRFAETWTRIWTCKFNWSWFKLDQNSAHYRCEWAIVEFELGTELEFEPAVETNLPPKLGSEFEFEFELEFEFEFEFEIEFALGLAPGSESKFKIGLELELEIESKATTMFEFKLNSECNWTWHWIWLRQSEEKEAAAWNFVASAGILKLARLMLSADAQTFSSSWMLLSSFWKVSWVRIVSIQRTRGSHMVLCSTVCQNFPNCGEQSIPKISHEQNMYWGCPQHSATRMALLSWVLWLQRYSVHICIFDTNHDCTTSLSCHKKVCLWHESICMRNKLIKDLVAACRDEWSEGRSWRRYCNGLNWVHVTVSPEFTVWAIDSIINMDCMNKSEAFLPKHHNRDYLCSVWQ